MIPKQERKIQAKGKQVGVIAHNIALCILYCRRGNNTDNFYLNQISQERSNELHSVCCARTFVWNQCSESLYSESELESIILGHKETKTTSIWVLFSILIFSAK